jgi:predicted amidophosphoribosyltransferase
MAKTYNVQEIQNAILATREGSDYFLLSYPPKRRMNDVSRLIWDFKENQPQAIKVVLEILLPKFSDWEKQLRRNDHCSHIVAIPGHEQGKQNAACEAVAATLCGKFHWLERLPNSLRRIKSVPKASHAASYQERPKYADHLKSIKYFGPKVSKGASIVMLDDVFTTSETSSACRDILIEHSGCAGVIGLFVGRTLND